MVPSITNFMEDDMVMALELFMLASNVRKKICHVLNDFDKFSFIPNKI